MPNTYFWVKAALKDRVTQLQVLSQLRPSDLNCKEIRNDEEKTELILYLRLLTLSANSAQMGRGSVLLQLVIRCALVIYVFGRIELYALGRTLGSWIAIPSSVVTFQFLDIA